MKTLYRFQLLLLYCNLGHISAPKFIYQSLLSLNSIPSQTIDYIRLTRRTTRIPFTKLASLRTRTCKRVTGRLHACMPNVWAMRMFVMASITRKLWIHAVLLQTMAMNVGHYVQC